MFRMRFDIVLISKKFPAPKSVYQPGLVPSEMCMVPMMQCALMQPIASWMLVFEQWAVYSNFNSSGHRTVYHFNSVSNELRSLYIYKYKWAQVQRNRWCFWITFTFPVYMLHVFRTWHHSDWSVAVMPLTHLSSFLWWKLRGKKPTLPRENSSC